MEYPFKTNDFCAVVPDYNKTHCNEFLSKWNTNKHHIFPDVFLLPTIWQF